MPLNNDPWAIFPDAPPIQPSGPQPPVMGGGPTPPLQNPSDPWAVFPDAEPATSPAKAMVPVADVALSGASGIVRGAAETAMMPITLPKLAADGIVNLGEWAIRKAFGMDPLSAEEAARRDQIAQENQSIIAPERLVSGVRGLMNDTLHKPETTVGEYAGTIGEFAVPGAIFGKAGKVEGLANKAKALVGDALIPALTSETAGQATEGTKMEPYARAIGAVAGTAGVGLARSRSSAPDAMIRDSVPTGPGAITPAEFEAAKKIQSNAQGVTITGPEAIQQATNGRTRLGSLARTVEGSQPGGAAMLPALSQRPGQIDDATQQILDAIAPRPSAPSTIGPKAQAAATSVLDDTRQSINDASRPSYAASANTPLPFVDFAKDPNYSRTVDWVRQNLKGFDDIADNSVEMADAVSKRLFDEASAAQNSTNSSFSNQVAAERGSSASMVRDTARQNSPDYNTALNVQEIRRNDILNPLEQGPVGKIAKTADTREAYSQILPKAPLSGGEDEIAKAVMAIGERDPGTASALVRQGMADAYDSSAKRLVGGENQYAGARYAKEIAGSPQQEINLNAVLSSLPDEMVAAIFPDYLEVMRATGQRMPLGSPTAYNNMIQQEASQGSLMNQAIDTARSAGTGLGTIITDATKRKLYGKNMGALGEMFVDPNSVDLIMEAIMRGGPAPARDTAKSIMFTAPQQARSKEEERKAGGR
jgi:hypothetical protein